MAAAPVIALVIEAIHATVSGVMSARLAHHPFAEARLVGRALGVGRRGGNARHVAHAHRILQNLVSLGFHGVPSSLRLPP